MKNIQLIFRKVSKGDSWYQWIIAFYTGYVVPLNWGTKGFYCHTEIHFVERKLCYSSANITGGKLGVRFAPDSEVLKEPSKWEGFIITLGGDEEQRLYDACKELEGAPYDWLGLFGGFITGFLQNKKHWYCSEVCANRMFEAGLYPDKFSVVSPIRWAAKSSEHFSKELIPL